MSSQKLFHHDVLVATILLSYLLCSSLAAATNNRPNIIIMQPDDLPFFDEWLPPPNTSNEPARQSTVNPLPAAGLPNIERLRSNGLQMTNAYAAASMCGTSRYTTMTSRYASRSATSRAAADRLGRNPADVTIPRTKLEDVAGYGNDCSRDNIAQEFQSAGYRTMMAGKWHLSSFTDVTYTYENAVSTVRGCGFDTVGCLYVENLDRPDGGADVNAGNDIGVYSDGLFSHNMECMTDDAIQFIEEAATNDEPFFLYFNPTVPHGANGVDFALTEYTCRDTPGGVRQEEPCIPGMTGERDVFSNGECVQTISCQEYRDTIYERSNNVEDDLGPIWLDDAVGALLQALEDNGVLDNTIFLFQEDHGQESKGTLYEGGVRIPQFIHYPDMILAGSTFDGPVSTIDVGVTMLDFAGIVSSYTTDGRSWKSALMDTALALDWELNRCIFFEQEQDRAARCGCYKSLSLVAPNRRQSTTWGRGSQQGLANDIDSLFDLCGGGQNYITDPDDNQETINMSSDEPNTAQEFSDLLQCHADRIAPDSSLDFTDCNVPPQKVPAVIMNEPNWSSITSTSATIAFTTSRSAQVRIIYATNRRLRRRNRKRSGFIRTRSKNGFKGEISLTDLKPGTRYYYRIIILNGVSDKKRYSFKTDA